MAKVNMETVKAVETAITELEERDPKLVNTCGLCNRTLFDKLMQIKVKTGAPQRTVCNVFSRFYNEGKRPEDQVSGKNFRDRIDRIIKANEAELKSRSETINCTDTEYGDCDEKEEERSKADDTKDNQCPLNAYSEPIPSIQDPVDKEEAVEKLLLTTMEALRELEVSERNQQLFYLSGLESYSGCYGFTAVKPERAIKKLIDRERFGTESLARMIVRAIKESEVFELRDIDTLVEWLVKLKKEMEELLDESVVTTDGSESEGAVYHREGSEVYREEQSVDQR